jgi:3-hydroxyisobutyrate dehydrogenase-like beta-hydroxyacid dehydrogenase
MVRDYAQNVDVILSKDGLLSAQSKGKTIIVMSTLDPETMNGLGEKVEAESDFNLISAAVSGGHSGAEAGTLSIMTSGSEAIVKGFQPGRQAGQQYDPRDQYERCGRGPQTVQ